MMRVLLLVLMLILNFQSDLQFDPDELDVITLDNVNQIEEIASVDNDLRLISMSPDGKLTAWVTQYQDNDYSIIIMDSQTDEVISSMRGRMDSFVDLIWSPDSSRIAVISGRKTGGGVEERSVKTYLIETGSHPNFYGMGNSDTWYADYVYPPDTPGNAVEVAWSPESDMIAIAFHERLTVQGVTENSDLFTTPVIGIYAVEWSLDGKWIITRSDNRSVRMWGIPYADS